MTVATFTSVINQMLPEPHAGLLNGILFGTKATISRELTDALIVTGTLHIVALSGMNITILSGLISTTLLWIVGRRVASLITIVLIAGFVWFVGASPSIVRAGIMGSISLIAVIFGRQYWGLLTWGLAVGMMLLPNPSWISDISFQLSAAATLGIILFGGKAQEKGERVSILRRTEDGTPSGAYPHSALRTCAFLVWKLVESDLRLTLAAQALTIPLILLYFHRISLISPVVNVLIGWIVQPLTVVGLLTAITGWIFLPLGQVLAWGAWVGLQYLIMIVMLLSKVPGASMGG